MARPKLPLCPNCGEYQLQTDRKAGKDHRGNHVRRRLCPCGYYQTEEIIVTQHFPESHVCDEPKHPGEGGYGFTRGTPVPRG